MSPRALFADPFFRRGVREMLPFVPGMGAWGLVTGVAMTQSGLGVNLSLLMSLTVFAGSAQLSSLPLFAVHAPAGVIWASALCVNLRFIIFSAQWRTHLDHVPRGRRLLLAYVLADLSLVVFQKAWPSGRHEPGQARYIAGGAVVTWVVWQAASITGILLASMIPVAWGLGFAGTLSMLGIAYSMLKDRPTWLAAVVAATASVAAFALPLKLNILVAIAAAVAVSLVMAQATRAVDAMRQRP